MATHRSKYTPRSDDKIICGNCPQREQPAELWCTLCKQGLCVSCKVHHRNEGTTRRHEVLPIEEYKKLRQFVSNMKEFCGLHGKKFDNFCVEHNCPCCSVCMSSKHAKCQDVVGIDVNLTELKTPRMLSELQKRGKKLLNDIASIRDNRKDNIKHIEQQRLKIRAEITNARKTINAFLDKIEHDTLVNLTVAEEKQITELDKVMKEFDARERNIKQVNTYVSNIKNFGSDAKTFLATCEMETRLAKEEQSLLKLYEDERLKHRELSINFNPAFNTLYHEVKSLGDITVKKTPARIASSKSRSSKSSKNSNARYDQATVTVFGVRKPTCLLTLKRSISIQKGNRDNYITGCSVLPSGKFVFVDCSDKRLIVCHEDGSHNRDISLPNQPWDLAVVNKQQVAVTVPLENTIVIIDVANGTTVQEFKQANQCYGIDYAGGNLVVVFHRDGIRFIDLEGNTVGVLNLSVSNVWYVTVSGDNIVYSEWNTHTVHCCDLDGKSLWKFKDETLRNPRAVTADEEGHIYVTGRWSNNVVAISPDGKQSKVLLSKSDGLDHPTGILYEKGKKRLLICTSFHGSVSYYEVANPGQRSSTCSIS